MFDSPELAGIIKRQQCADELMDLPSEELVDLVNSIFTASKDRRVTDTYLLGAPTYDDLFIASGACDVLRQRHGNDYVYALIGKRSPRTIREKVRYFFTRELPTL